MDNRTTIFRVPQSLISCMICLTLLLASCTAFQNTVSPSTPAGVTQPTINMPTQPPQEIPAQPAAASPTAQIFLPEVQGPGQDTPAAPAPTPEPTGPGTMLAFLKDDNLWTAIVPDGALTQLTTSGDLLSFAWSPDGTMLAIFNGRSLCAIQTDGTPVGTCIDLGLTEEQTPIERRIVWSPDQRSLVLWNALNPWDESSLGWIIVYRNSSGTILKISDPVDWGFGAAPNNEPGGFTGQPVFLADGSLIGTLSHRWLCGSGSCLYQLYSFDLAAKIFSPYPNKPEEGWSEGANLLLSADKRLLLDFGVFNATCDSAVTFLDIYDLGSGNRQLINLKLESLDSIAFSPDSNQLLLSRTTPCSNPQSQSWDRACGLSQGLDLLPMQRLDLDNNEKTDLAPGVQPAWSPDGNWVAFRSCLNQNESGGWDPSAAIASSIYIMSPDGSGIHLVAQGSAPAWQP
jgi:hypothetical protein